MCSCWICLHQHQEVCGRRGDRTASSGSAVGTDPCAGGGGPGNQLRSGEWKACLLERAQLLRLRLGRRRDDEADTLNSAAIPTEQSTEAVNITYASEERDLVLGSLSKALPALQDLHSYVLLLPTKRTMSVRQCTPGWPAKGTSPAQESGRPSPDGGQPLTSCPGTARRWQRPRSPARAEPGIAC